MKLYNKKNPDIVMIPVNWMPDGSKIYKIIYRGEVVKCVRLYDNEISKEWIYDED